MTHYDVISHSHPQIDSLEKVTGRLQFMSDLRLPNMLWGHIVRSPHPHALIKKINIDQAEKVPGVKAIITAADTPQIPCGPFVPDWEILAQEKVRFIGQEVVAVAALTPEIAAYAAHLIEIEYEELPAVFDPEEAMKEQSPQLYENRQGNIANTFSVEKGDLEKAFRESAFVREETFYTSSAFHAYLEPNGSIASYDGSTDSYTMWLATQVPYKAWVLYSQALGIDRSRLRIIQAPIGGGFGGKFESNLHLVTACLSKKANQPVRIVNSLEEEFVTATLRVPMKIKIKMGITQDGMITAKDVEVFADNGARTNYGPATLMTACYRVDSLYRIQNVRAKGYLVYTNNVPKGAMRGFGNPQMILALESLLDMLAEDAGIDPFEIRKRNAFKNGEISVHGWIINSCGLVECLEKASKALTCSKKQELPPHKKRGFGVACCNHVSGYRPILKEFDGSSAMIKVGPDAKVIVYSGEVDMGQGYRTVAAMAAAEELGVPLHQVEVAPVDSATSILGIGCLASRGTVMGGNAVKKAAEDLKDKILEASQELFNKDKKSIEMCNGQFRDSNNGEILGSFHEVIAKLTGEHAGKPFVGLGDYVPDTVFPDPVTKYGNPSPAYSFAAHIAEVEVDTETGKVEVSNFIAANDVGQVINPLLANGQLEGGALQAIGWVLSENLVIQKGEILNKNLLDYKIPTFADSVPVVPLLIEAHDSNGPYGAKSLGEPAFNPVAAAVCNAIYNAVGIRVKRLPLRPEELLEAINQGKREI
jgi:CO/xanthine dehydrogenase Mo-binding subunit